MRFLLLFAASTTLYAQLTGTYAITGGTLIDGYGGPPIRDSVIVVNGERIVAAGAVGK